MTPLDSRSTGVLLILLVIWDSFAKLLPVTRRSFIQSGLAVGLATPVVAALRRERLDEAVEALARATREGQVAAAVLHVVHSRNPASACGTESERPAALGYGRHPHFFREILWLLERR